MVQIKNIFPIDDPLNMFKEMDQKKFLLQSILGLSFCFPELNGLPRCHTAKGKIKELLGPCQKVSLMGNYELIEKMLKFRKCTHTYR